MSGVATTTDDDQQPYNAANPRHVQKRTNKAKRDAEQRQEEFAELLKQAAFRRFLWHLICERCQIFQSPFNPNGSTQTLNIGRQDVGRELFSDVERIDPKLITLMMTEFAEAKS